MQFIRLASDSFRWIVGIGDLFLEAGDAVNSFMLVANQAMRKHFVTWRNNTVISMVLCKMPEFCRNAQKFMTARWKKSKLVWDKKSRNFSYLMSSLLTIQPFQIWKGFFCCCCFFPLYASLKGKISLGTSCLNVSWILEKSLLTYWCSFWINVDDSYRVFQSKLHVFFHALCV